MVRGRECRDRDLSCLWRRSVNVGVRSDMLAVSSAIAACLSWGRVGVDVDVGWRSIGNAELEVNRAPIP